MIGTENLINYYRFPERALSYIFYKNGYIVASKPWPVIIASIILFLITGSGMFRMQAEKPEDVWNLYFPEGNPATEGSVKLSEDFPSHSGDNYWPFQDTGDILSLNALFLVDGKKSNLSDVLKSVRESCQIVESLTAEINGQKYNYHNVCAMRPDFVEHYCVFPTICSDLESSAPTSICDREAYKVESNFVIDQTIVNASKDCSPDKEIIATPAIRLNWFFNKDTLPKRRLSESFIRQLFDKLFQKSKLEFPGTVYLFSTVVQFDEYHSIVQSDSPFMGVTIAMMTVFSILVSLKVPGFLKSRSILALAGVVATCFAIGSTLGVLAILGIPFIEVAFLTPFIMLGIGIDSTFVLMFTWANQQQQLLETLLDGHSPPSTNEKLEMGMQLAFAQEETKESLGLQKPQLKDLGVKICVGTTLRKAMISIFISSITSFIAFLVGSFTPYRAVNITCYHLAVFTVFLMIYETTFFTASLAIHHQRVINTFNPMLNKDNNSKQTKDTKPNKENSINTSIQNGTDHYHNNHNNHQNHDEKNGVIKSSSYTKFEPIPGNSDELDERANEAIGDRETSKSVTKVVRLNDHFNRLELLVKKWMPKLILHNFVRISAVLFVIALLAMSTYQVINMKQYFNEIEYQPDNSRILDYYTTSRKYYKDPIMVSLVIDEPVQYWNNSELDKLESIYFNLTAQDFSEKMVNDRIQPWFVLFSSTLRSVKTEKQFKRKIKDWQLLLSTSPYINDFKVENNSELVKSRFFLALKTVQEKDLDRTKAIIQKINEITSGYDHKLYFTSRDLMLWERNSHMRQSTWITILIALSSCIAVTVFLLPHPVVFISVSLCGAFTMISTLGCMALYGIEYSLCTYIIVLLMIGLCIDYISHTGHAYIVHMNESRFETTKKALENIGVPLFNAALSSIISVSMLGFSYSNMMRRLFVSIVLLFAFSFFYGVVFLPIILSVIGPTKKKMRKCRGKPRKPTSPCKTKNPSIQLSKSGIDTVPTISQKIYAEKRICEVGSQKEPLMERLNDNSTKEDHDQNDPIAVEIENADINPTVQLAEDSHKCGDKENSSSETNSNI